MLAEVTGYAEYIIRRHAASWRRELYGIPMNALWPIITFELPSSRCYTADIAYLLQVGLLKLMLLNATAFYEPPLSFTLLLLRNFINTLI